MGSDVGRVVEPILWTKLHRPQLDANLVARGRLIESMNSGLDVPLTLVSAPAGYGKSVLVAQWAEQLDHHIAWLSLDASDSGLRAFLRYFISAVDTIAPGACNATRELLQAETAAPEPVLAANLLNELDAIDTMSVIVLDDYHRIETLSPVQDLMLRMLEHPPKRLRFVVLTRQDPPFDLSSLRAGHRINEVRLQDLRFTANETREFMSVSTGLSVPDEVLVHLEREVEGWSAGLRLVSLALRHARNPEALLKGLPELLPDIQEYLLQEVLAAQPAEVRDRMLASAILDRFCAEVLDAVYEPPDTDDQTGFTAADFLKYLRKSNLFTVPLDARRKWFRYHHLFQEMLVTELKHLRGPEHVAALHLRASEWFEGEGLIDEALQHALAAGDTEQAADLVVRHRNTALGADQWSTLTNWLSLIPETIVRQRAELLLARAWIHLRHLFLFEPVPELLEQAASLLGDQPVNEALQGELALCRGFISWQMGEAAASLQHVDLVLQKNSVAHAESFAWIADMTFAASSQMVGQKERAIRFLDQQLARTDPVHQVRRRNRLLWTQVYIHLMGADLPDAELAQHRLHEAVERSGLPYEYAWADYMQGVIHLNRCEWEAAVDFLARSADRQFLYNRRAAADSFIGLMLAYRALGRDEEASEAMRSLQEFVTAQDNARMDVLVMSSEARLSLLEGTPGTARRWLAAREPPAEGHLFWWIDVPSITRSWARVAVGSPAELAQAEESLLACAAANEGHRNTIQLIRILALLAMAYEKQGKREQARRALERAVQMARKGDLVLPFVELGTPMVELLRDMPSASEFAAGVERRVAAFGVPTERLGERQAVEDAMAGPEGWRVATRASHMDLTNRELDILELLARRLQNKEISARLEISPQTVNSHLKQIYHKLGVHSRRKAVEKASEVGILAR